MILPSNFMNKSRKALDNLCVCRKKFKTRRETWAAPAIVKAIRTSLDPVPLRSINMDHHFLRPELPPWIDYSKASPVGLSPVSSDSSDTLNDCSAISDGM